VELISLRDKTIEVVNTEVPTGVYEYVGFRIDESRSYVVESDVSKPLAVPDGDVRVLGPFEVVAGRTTTLTLDFDAEQSLNRLPDGNWAMRPVVVLTVTTS
jgi:hypothetical protein